MSGGKGLPGPSDNDSIHLRGLAPNDASVVLEFLLYRGDSWELSKVPRSLGIHDLPSSPSLEAGESEAYVKGLSHSHSSRRAQGWSSEQASISPLLSGILPPLPNL